MSVCLRNYILKSALDILSKKAACSEYVAFFIARYDIYVFGCRWYESFRKRSLWVK